MYVSALCHARGKELLKGEFDFLELSKISSYPYLVMPAHKIHIVMQPQKKSVTCQTRSYPYRQPQASNSNYFTLKLTARDVRIVR